MHSYCRTALNACPRAMTASVASRGRAAIPRARRVGGGRGGAASRRAPVTASGSSKERSSSAVVGSDQGAESGWGPTRLARTAVSLVASVAVLAPPPGAFTIETFRDGDDAASSSTRESRRHHPSSSDDASRLPATGLHPTMSTMTNSGLTTVPMHASAPSFIGARAANAFDLDPWKEGRARKAAQRAELQRRVDESYAREAENREEKERLQAAYYAKASASRKARVQALRDGATEEEADAAAADAGTRAFDTAVRAIDAEAEALEAYELRNAELRATAEQRNAEALAAASAAEAVLNEEVRLGEECAEGVNPLDEPGSVMCT